jgi:hypothetical protein
MGGESMTFRDEALKLLDGRRGATVDGTVAELIADAIAARHDVAVEEMRLALADDRQAFDYIVSADKTRYDYPPGRGKGEVARKRDGSLPPTGQAWLTPKEKARDRIKVLAALLGGAS